MQKRYPFKFLDAYAREDGDFFFGRAEEIEALYGMVFQTDLLLVYGASGTGKTSLIQCGLANKFQSHDWLALNVRRGANLNESLDMALAQAGGGLGGTESDRMTASHPITGTFAEPALDWLDEDFSDEAGPAATGEPLSPLARRLKAIYLRHFKPLYLIFDQFEELYILGNKAEQGQFVETVREILRVKQPVKLILSIREEYLGHLYEFERAVPELLRKKLRVEPMHLDKVKTVVQSTGERADSLVRLRAGEGEAIAEGIFDKIRGEEKTLHIALPYLQVFLDKLYLHATGDKTRQSEAEFSLQHLREIGDLGDVLRNFLDEQVRDMAGELSAAEEQVWQMLSPFVTLEGTKEPLSEAQLADRLPNLPPDLLRRALQAFVTHRILRYSEGAQLYEIAHDALAKQIHAKRSDEEIALLEVQRLVKSQTAMKAEAREFFSEKQLLFMEPYLHKYRPGAEEEDWIRQSREHVRREKEAATERERAELERARQQAEQERALRAQAEVAMTAAESQRAAAQQSERTARQRSRIAAVVALLALAGLGTAVWQFIIANQATREAQSAQHKAKESENAALLAKNDAKKSEQAALDSAAVARQQRLETLLANKNTAAALEQLEITADQAMSIVLPDIDRNIYRLEYGLTYPKCQTAVNLNARRGEVEKRVWEMAYFYTEADSAAAAIAFLNLLKPLDFKANTPNVQAKLRRYLAQTVPTRYLDSLQARYYPPTVLVEGGSFLREEDGEIVRVNTFRMGQTEITYWQYNLFAEAENYHIEPPSWEYAGDNPAIYVNWFDAAFYLNWLSQRWGKQKVYTLTNPQKGDWGTVFDVTIDSTAKGYRLPTEAEWEFAARGGNKTNGYEYSGSNTLDEVGWYGDNANSRTHSVRQKARNELYLYDMSGNVWEWCQEEWGSDRVLRGGAWNSYPEVCRVADRSRYDPDNRNYNIGFRLVFVP